MTKNVSCFPLKKTLRKNSNFPSILKFKNLNLTILTLKIPQSELNLTKLLFQIPIPYFTLKKIPHLWRHKVLNKLNIRTFAWDTISSSSRSNDENTSNRKYRPFHHHYFAIYLSDSKRPLNATDVNLSTANVFYMQTATKKKD